MYLPPSMYKFLVVVLMRMRTRARVRRVHSHSLEGVLYGWYPMCARRRCRHRQYTPTPYPPAKGTTSSRESKGASTERPSNAKRSQRPCRAQVTRRTTNIIASRVKPLKKGNRTMGVRIRHVVKSGSAFWCLQRALSF